MSSSGLPKARDAIETAPRPRLDCGRARPTLPANSGFQRSAQLVGGVFTVCLLKAMPKPE